MMVCIKRSCDVVWIVIVILATSSVTAELSSSTTPHTTSGDINITDTRVSNINDTADNETSTETTETIQITTTAAATTAAPTFPTTVNSGTSSKDVTSALKTSSGDVLVTSSTPVSGSDGDSGSDSHYNALVTLEAFNTVVLFIVIAVLVGCGVIAWRRRGTTQQRSNFDDNNRDVRSDKLDDLEKNDGAAVEEDESSKDNATENLDTVSQENYDVVGEPTSHSYEISYHRNKPAPPLPTEEVKVREKSTAQEKKKKKKKHREKKRPSDQMELEGGHTMTLEQTKLGETSTDTVPLQDDDDQSELYENWETPSDK